MFKKGDIVRRKEHQGADYATGTVLRTYYNEDLEVADILWAHEYRYVESWALDALISANDPVDLLKEII